MENGDGVGDDDGDDGDDGDDDDDGAKCGAHNDDMVVICGG